MKIHEYQAKEILRKYGIATPQGIACFSIEEAVNAARELGGQLWIVKAQIYAGGRGKGGGVKVAKSLEEVRQHASAIVRDIQDAEIRIGHVQLLDRDVRRLLIEQGVPIEQEYYVGLVTDRRQQRVCLMASSEGGMDIEKVAAETPEKIHKVLIDPVTGLNNEQASEMAQKIGISTSVNAQVSKLLRQLYQAFDETDASLVEINPLVLTVDKQVIALDAKMNFDDNALFRHPEIAALRDLDEEDPVEVEASKHDLSYIPLDGTIGCLVNGAGLAMATMDIIKLYGGNPANFLDVGGGATVEKVTEAFKLMLKNPKLQAILVNIFGGIMKCDVIAQGVVAAAREVKLSVPLVVRLEGTNVELGKKILQESNLTIISADGMADAAEKVVRATGSQVNASGQS